MRSWTTILKFTRSSLCQTFNHTNCRTGQLFLLRALCYLGEIPVNIGFCLIQRSGSTLDNGLRYLGGRIKLLQGLTAILEQLNTAPLLPAGRNP